MSTYLMHHGIKGMKWGVRRYQNDDGTLTAAGKARYGDSKTYTGDIPSSLKGVARTVAKSSLTFRNTVARARVDRLNDRSKAWQEEADQARAMGKTKHAEIAQKRADKNAEKLEAQAAANANRKAYDDRTSTGKMIAQDFLLSKYGAQNYRAARARGAGRVRSLLEANAGLTPVATLLAMQGNKKAYGKRLVLSAI